MRRVRGAAAWGLGAWALTAAVPALPAWPTAADDPLPELQRLAREGRADRALSQLDALSAAHPDDPRWLFEKGLLLTSQKRVGDAIAVYERLTHAHPTLPEPWNNLGVLYASTGELEKSRAAFESALQCQQAARVAHANLGHVNLRLAGTAYARALHIDGGPKTLALAQIERLAPVAGPTAAPAQTAPSTALPTVPPVVASTNSLPAPPVASLAASAPPVSVASAAASRTTVAVRTAPSPTPPVTAPAPVPASAPPPQAAAKPSAPTADTALAREVQVAITAWAAAWSRKDVDAYAAAYVPGYKGSDASAQAWQAARRVRILGKSRIAVGVSRVAIELGKDNTATASFRQSYVADQLNVNSAKTLDFVKLNGRWLIRKEVAGS